ncbi:hypothetical protein H5410_025772 [Solanum commersonii]|uniref:Uncharacterized protein n=1 Tax=Solanum commersonii TaxID=4109 RepID=A0A9J5YWU6_SOLCO|nr:hypothetical protein H5410_025772 [Solanum commersonii]
MGHRGGMHWDDEAVAFSGNKSKKRVIDPSTQNVENPKHDDIMNGLVSDMRFLLKYTMGGLTLQVSRSVSCLECVVYHAYCGAYFQSRLE